MDELKKVTTLDEEFALDDCSCDDPPVTCNCCCSGRQEVTFNACQDVSDITNIPATLQCLGRLLRVTVTIPNACRGRLINIGVLVCEGSDIRGFKVCRVMVPTGTPSDGPCTSITTDMFCFVLSEEAASLCTSRTVTVRVLANYTTSMPAILNCSC